MGAPMTEADLIVLGAGPAGMAAACQAAGAGLSVLVLDEQPRAGGQIYRDVARAAALRGRILGPDYTGGQALVAALDHPLIAHLPGAVAWRVDPDGTVAFSRAGVAGMARGRRLLVATGALERPMPVPGWTLPGVMTAGAAQILLKASGVVAGDAVLAGSGPLLYLVAAQMVRAGTPPRALVETQGTTDLLAAARHLPGALAGWRMLAKGGALLRELAGAGVPRFRGASAIAVEGADHATAITFDCGGTRHRIPCSTVLLHHGVVPNTQVTRSLALAHDWDAAQRAFRPVRDGWGRTSLSTVFVAGDGAGIGGAGVAALSGRLAALAIAHDLGRICAGDRDLAARPLRVRRALDLAARPFLDRAFPPFRGALAPDDATIICRCEEVTAGDIRRHAALGTLGPNQAKAFSRAGMGPCQGRFCAASVAEILAALQGTSPGRIGTHRVRAPLKPVTLAEIAALADDLPGPGPGAS